MADNSLVSLGGLFRTICAGREPQNHSRHDRGAAERHAQPGAGFNCC